MSDLMISQFRAFVSFELKLLDQHRARLMALEAALRDATDGRSEGESAAALAGAAPSNQDADLACVGDDDCPGLVDTDSESESD